MKTLLDRQADGDDDADYFIKVLSDQNHFIVYFYFRGIPIVYNTFDGGETTFCAVFSTAPDPKLISKLKRYVLEDLDSTVKISIYQNLKILVAEMSPTIFIPEWVRLIEIVIKGMTGALETYDDFMDVLQIKEATLRQKLIEQNGGFKKIIKVTQPIVLDTFFPYQLLTWKKKISYLVEQIQDETSLLYPCCSSKNNITSALSFVFGLPLPIHFNSNTIVQNFGEETIEVPIGGSD